MGRQGKMANTPFHVENARYKYAVEHESGYEQYQKIKPIPWQVCGFRNSHDDTCKFWFINSERCIHKKCPYKYKAKRRREDCLKCRHSKISNRQNLRCTLNEKLIQANMGTFCQFFQIEDSNT